MKYLLRLLAIVFCLAASVPAQSQTFNLSTGLQVSKTSQLRLGEEILVSVTVGNAGPDAALDMAVAAGPAQEDGYLYLLVGSEPSSACGPPSEVETDPPQWSVVWTVPVIPVGGTATCVARLRVALVPGSHSATMQAGAYSNRDTNLADNFAQVALGFASARGALRIPASSWWAVIVAAASVIALLRATGRV